jgi:hypothetical protein
MAFNSGLKGLNHMQTIRPTVKKKMPPTLIKLPHADVPSMAEIKKFTVKKVIDVMEFWYLFIKFC